MSTTLEKEWAAIDGEEIVMTEDTRGELSEELKKAGLSEEDLEIVALPKSHNSLFI